MVSYNFNKQIQILETQFKGNVYLTEILDYIITSRSMGLPENLKILTDARNASFKFYVGELDSIIAETEKSLNHFKSITNAIIIDSPETAALSTIYQEIANKGGYHFNVFSTKEAALNWLNTF